MLSKSPQVLLDYIEPYFSPAELAELVGVENHKIRIIDTELYDLLSERYAFELEYRFNMAVYERNRDSWPYYYRFADMAADNPEESLSAWVQEIYDIKNPLLAKISVAPLHEMMSHFLNVDE